MYSLRAFGTMIADAERVGAYAEAIAAAVRPGDSVVDVGCGVGLFSLLACRAGARRVYAIESDDCIQVARQLAIANGMVDKVEFIQGDSGRTELPERVNLIVSDIRGVLPLFQNVIPTLEDAKRRFLAAGGTMIPQRDVLKAALIEAPDFYSRLTSPWETQIAGLDLKPPLVQLLNQLQSSSFQREQLVTAPQDWGELDYLAGAQTSVARELNFAAARPGTVHGVCLWFETKLFGEIGYTSQPGTRTVHGQMILPLLKPVPVEEGTRIHVGLHADLINRDYLWRWETKIAGSSGQPELHLVQSTFQGASFSTQNLRRQEFDYIPALSEAGEAELWMLGQMRGEATLRSIAQGAFEKFPGVFASWQAAFEKVAELSKRASR